MKENKKKKRQLKDSEYVLLIMLVLIVVLGFVYLGQKEVLKKKQRVDIQTAILKRYYKEEEKIQKLFEDVSEARDYLPEINRAIPDRENLVLFVDQLEHMGEVLGLATSVSLTEGYVEEEGLISGKLSDAAKEIVEYTDIDGVEVLEIGVSLSGKVDQFVNYIGMLKDTKYYNQITAYKLSKNIAEEGEDISMVITLNVFVKSIE